jgi:hypothetical protein
MNEINSCLLEKVYMINKPLTNLTKMRREKTQINKIRDKNGELIQTAWQYKESLGINLKTYIQIDWKNIEEMDKFLDTYD